MKINITSATGQYEKECGSLFLFTKDKEGHTKTIVYVANILCTDSWNVIDKTAGRTDVIHEGLTKEVAISKAKSFIRSKEDFGEMR